MVCLLLTRDGCCWRTIGWAEAAMIIGGAIGVAQCGVLRGLSGCRRSVGCYGREDILVAAVGCRDSGNEYQRYFTLIGRVWCSRNVHVRGVFSEIDADAIPAMFDDQGLHIDNGIKGEPDCPGLVGGPSFFIFVSANELLCNSGGGAASAIGDRCHKIQV